MELVFGFLGAIFADLRKVVLDSLLGKELKWGGPYSLGKLIDWKQDTRAKSLVLVINSPYSLGKLIDWKPLSNL